MSAVFLSGGGDKKFTEKLDKGFKDAINPSKPLLYIPIAMKNLVPYEDCFEWVNSVFLPMGIQEIVMWTDVNQKSLNELKRFSAIYIGGGNTFALLEELRSSKFDLVLTEFIQSGGIVYGGSAGAIILGANIMTCAHLDTNEVALRDYSGLSLIGDYAIWCHYDSSDDELIRNYIKVYQKPVIALPEETGILFDKGLLRVTGTKPASIFKGIANKKKLEAGAEPVIL